MIIPTPTKSLLPQKWVFCPKSLFGVSFHSLITIYQPQFLSLFGVGRLVLILVD